MAQKDLGMVTSYAYALSKGYTGTEEEFAEGVLASAEYADNAQASATAAAQSKIDAEAAASSVQASAQQIATNTADIADIKSDLNNKLTHDYIPLSVTFTDGKYIKLTDGYNISSTSFAYTDYFIDVSKYESLYISIPISTNSYHAEVVCAVAFYTTNSYDSYIVADAVPFETGSENGYDVKILYVPATAKYMRVSTLVSIKGLYSVSAKFRNTQVVENIESLLKTTCKNVLVLHNNHSYGDGGACWFGVYDGYTARGITRDDGTVVYPLPNQSPLITAHAPYDKIMDVVGSYVGVDSLVYGNDNTMYDTTCSNEIDCSTFVTAVLNGVTYDNSRYSLGTSEKNIIGEHVGDTRLSIENGQYSRLLSDHMAQWFAQHKLLYELPANNVKALNMLQFGDILFSGVDGVNDDYYYGIGHVAVVIGVNPEVGFVVVAQAGGSGNYSNEQTVVKTSAINITNESLSRRYRVFARPDYSQDYVDLINFPKILQAYSNNGKINISQDTGIRFQLNTIIVDGRIGTSQYFMATPDFYPVIPNASIIYDGELKGEDSGETPYQATMFRYDRNKKFISSNGILVSNQPVSQRLTADTYYVRFTFGHTNAQGVPMTIKDMTRFSAVMTLPS